mmetsp:Transcript_64530/g.76399  ORF Transcript_64530/g.76399 Transcript_64530/m.76399 type:complete len:212 (+) Transcript_64530:163-798(+)|eukprot:CAMPEP_0172517474 /NCGR_PEP_ID=MMETSP1066-20121228/285341_1 /TAXON_ID=671091 /ORGANISM="Coscinodiscus wailesii, Strain CCMP2513" /LENGTH=211 /DNA_ID=CAMNT_0013299489 /DNA_START=150 /DNA_END=785 /DNA_ORIENTATION=+
MSDYYTSYEQPATSGPPPQRKRLQLKPRSVGTSRTPQSQPSPRSSSSNPFGNAKPREEVLAGKGIDAKLVDARIQKKATTLHLTRDQEMQVNTLQRELDQIQKSRREANEKELPEEHFRIAEEKKKKELNDLMKQFSEMNTADSAELPESAGNTGSDKGGFSSGGGGSNEPRRQFERPSERRKRMEQRRENGENEGGYHGGSGRREYSSHW